VPIAERPSAADAAAVRSQLGRPPRADYLVAARGACGLPAVIQTPPRLPDGSPFPTVWYLTCRTLAAAAATLESESWMTRAGRELDADPAYAAGYRKAHDEYLRAREAIGFVPELAGVSAGGMPDRVKCVHALIGHSLAAGPGVNPVGDAALTELRGRGLWPCRRPCVSEDPVPATGPADTPAGATPADPV